MAINSNSKICSVYYIHSNIWRKITTAEKLPAFIRNLLILIKQEKKILPLLSIELCTFSQIADLNFLLLLFVCLPRSDCFVVNE